MALPTTSMPLIPELWFGILGQMSRADLLNVCLVNRALHQIAESVLYDHIEWTWLEAGDLTLVPLLLRSILQRPILGTYVKRLTLLGESPRKWHGVFPPPIPVDNDITSAASDAVRASDVPAGHQDLWVEGLASREMDAFVALLLSRLPELQSLNLGPIFCKQFAFTGRMLRLALGNVATNVESLPFQRLKEVSCENSLDTSLDSAFRNTNDMLPFFYLPHVRKLKLYIENPLDMNTFLWPAPQAPDPSNLTSLDLVHVREEFLTKLLSVTKALKSLRWNWLSAPCRRREKDPVHDWQAKVIDLDQFMMAVEPVRHTLCELTVAVDSVGGEGEPDPEIIYVKGSVEPLVQFEKLRTVQAPMPFLLGATVYDSITRRIDQVLPRNIEHLRISDDTYVMHPPWDADCLEEVIEWWLGYEGWRHATPHLTHFSLVIREEPGLKSYWNPRVQGAVAAMCAEAGIEYGFVDETDLEKTLNILW